VISAILEDQELPMTVCDHPHLLPAAGAALCCLLLTVCAGQTSTATSWVKSGADDQTIARELADCNAQANAALANEQGINADINATLGRNWQLGGTQAIEAQSMRRQASGYADQVLNNCMRAKGFSKEG
jgi:alkylation response protein AidB-like acyl-CoA dehydrogenase